MVMVLIMTMIERISQIVSGPCINICIFLSTIYNVPLESTFCTFIFVSMTCINILYLYQNLADWQCSTSNHCIVMVVMMMILSIKI